MTLGLLHALDKFGGTHTKFVGDINQALKGDSSPTVFDSRENASQEADPLSQFLQAESTRSTQVGDARSDLTTPLRRKARATVSR